MPILLEKATVSRGEDKQTHILAQRIKKILKSIRSSARQLEPLPNQLATPVFTETRKTLLHQEVVDRLVIFLRGSGCHWVEQTGGCTFCGFYSATNRGKKISDSDFLDQLNLTLSQYENNLSSFPIISLYNDGSMLSEKEISFTVLLKIIERLSKIPTLQRITIESRIADITDAKINALRKSTNKEIELAFGFESANPLIRKICVNKNFTNQHFLEICEKLSQNQIDTVALMMLKPPFLNEREAIEDAINSIRFLNTAKIYRIDIELPTVEKFTLTHKLWENEMYNPIMLWSVIDILEKNAKFLWTTPIYISPPRYTVPSLAMSSNCALCNRDFIQAFNRYNTTGFIEKLQPHKRNELCSCYRSWEKILLENTEEPNLLERVQIMIGQLEEKFEI